MRLSVASIGALKLSGVVSRLGIGWLFTAALIPGLLVGSVLLYEIYRSERAQLEQGALQTAHALSLAVDKDLAGIRGKLQILAASPALQAGDLRTFYHQAQDALASDNLAGVVALIDEKGQLVINTFLPFGSELPKTGHPELLRRTFETGQPTVSDLFTSTVVHRPLVALEVPVWRDGKVAYALDMGIPAERLNQLLVQQHLPSGWVAALIDSQGTVVARSQNAARYTGRPGTPDLLAQMKKSTEGTMASHTLEGTPSFAAFSRSDSSGWTLVVGMTRDVLYANLYRPLAVAGLAIVAFLLGGAVLAGIFTRQLRNSLSDLEAATKAGAAGNLDAMAPLAGPREVTQLAKQFNEMQQARKIAEECLRQSQQFSDDIINSLPGIFYMMDKAGRYVRWNQRFCEVTGYGADELSQMHASQLFDDGTAALIQERIGEVFKQGESSVEAPMLVKDGRRIPYYFTGHRTSIGNEVYLVGLGIDITERKAAEAKAIQQEVQFRQLSESLPQLVWTCTPKGLCDYVSPQWLAYTGIPADEQKGKGWRTCLHPEDRPVTEVAWRSANEQQTTFDVEFRLHRHDGAYRWFRTRGVPLFGNDGQVFKWFGTCTDIHDLKQAQNALLDSEHRLALALEASGSAVWELDVTSEIVRGEDRFFSMLGYGPSEIETVGAWLSLIHEEDRKGIPEEMKEVIEGKRDGFRFEFRVRAKDGHWRWILSQSAVAERNTEGVATRLVGTHTDIQARKKAEAEIQRLNADLEQRVAERTAELTTANRELEGFTFATSHDLKGPLGRINSFSAILEQRYRDRLEGDGRMFLGFIRQNAIRLNQLVDDLLTHARVAQQTLELQPVDLRAVVKAVLQEKAVDTAVAGTKIELDLPPVEVLGDLYAIEQALTNILENALKYSAHERSSVIEIGGLECDGHVRLWVRDNGIGFDMIYRDKIFEIFRRLHTYNQYEGSGVGLALVKRAMERMGGRVWAESEPGQGSTFFLEFQLAPQLAES